MTTAYYIEHDGRVLTVHRHGQHTLPTEEPLDVPFTEVARRELLATQVVFGQAELDEHPEHWPRKDDLAQSDRVHLLVRAAIDASHFRPVVGVLVRHGEKVLLVNPSRGVAKGHWTLPGGFLNAFEQPKHGAAREVAEETGLEIHDVTLAGTITYHHPGSPYPILGLAFTARADTDEVTPRPGEIGEARWFAVAEVQEHAAGFAAQVIERLAKEGRL